MTTLQPSINTNFTSKEHYLEFRAAWSAAVNSGKAKSHLEDHTAYWKSETGQHKVSGWINAEHHIVYNLLRNHEAHKGFTPITRKTKLENGAYLNHGFYWGIYELNKLIKQASTALAKKQEDKPNAILSAFGYKKDKQDAKPSWIEKRLDAFLAPFNGTITIEMLANLELPKVEPIYSDFGSGKKIALKMLKGEITVNTMDELQTQLEAA